MIAFRVESLKIRVTARVAPRWRKDSLRMAHRVSERLKIKMNATVSYHTETLKKNLAIYWRKCKIRITATFYNFLKFPALFSHLFGMEKSVGNLKML